MDWPRFLILLKTKRLYFGSVKVLQSVDLFEGSLPTADKQIYLSHMSEQTLKNGVEAFRRRILVSCWHYNDSESLAMWKIYAPMGNGIAIQTSVPDFKKAFDATSVNVYAGRVIYIDYETERFYENVPEIAYPLLNGFVAFIHKRKIYDWEQEYRALVQDMSVPDGISVDVDLKLLIKRVVVAPKTPAWIIGAVQLLLDELLPGVRAERSLGDLEPTN